MRHVKEDPLRDLHKIREKSAQELEGLTLAKQVELINARARRIEEEFDLVLPKYQPSTVLPPDEAGRQQRLAEPRQRVRRR